MAHRNSLLQDFHLRSSPTVDIIRNLTQGRCISKFTLAGAESTHLLLPAKILHGRRLYRSCHRYSRNTSIMPSRDNVSLLDRCPIPTECNYTHGVTSWYRVNLDTCFIAVAFICMYEKVLRWTGGGHRR